MSDSKNIEPDKALVDIKHDALGVAVLAKRIASSIIYMTSNDGLVIGLYGAWGSGKTTFINFVKQAILSHDAKEQPVVLYQPPYEQTCLSQSRLAIDLMRPVSLMRAFHALQQASTIAS